MVTMTATSTISRRSARATTCPPDSKYSKHRKQRKGQQLKQSAYLLGLALVVLIYTWWTLLGVPESSVSDASATKRHAARKEAEGRARRRKKQQLEEEEAEERDDHSANFLRGVTDMLYGDTSMWEELLLELNRGIVANKDIGIRWVRPELLPPLGREDRKPLLELPPAKRKGKSGLSKFFAVARLKKPAMAWEDEEVPSKTSPRVDFTTHSYKYPEKLKEPPEELGEYPELTPMKEIMKKWPQDDIDHPPATFEEKLIHFDYTIPEEVEAAGKFRDAKLPFKLTNVPEVLAARDKWTDEYVQYQFDQHNGKRPYPAADGNCQESPDNFFAFFAKPAWFVDEMGLAPTRNNDWTFEKWAEHARYADATSLSPHKPHFYWQAGVDREERKLPYEEWTFISRDLPSFSSPAETFFVFEPESQKGIQCRFGERGVTAATHFDSGRNMIAMIEGAKRYILSPPKQCRKLGIATQRGNAMYRHSMLNFGHLNHMDNEEMPFDEHEWLKQSGNALAIETVVKAGEVLYIPSHWFHYITSLQKSAQCNVRSGVDVEGDGVFGGKADVTERCSLSVP